MDIISELKKLIENATSKDRAVSIDMVAEQIMSDLWNRDEEFYWLLNFYVEESALVAVVTANGKLYKMPVTINQGMATVGDPVEIEIELKPVSQQRFMIHRQADGRVRFFAIAATSVINRVGEIDSKSLFDSFVEHAEETGKYPFLTFYHVGESLVLGHADYIGREGETYIVSGLINDDDLGLAMVAGIESDPEYWGVSIGFYADYRIEEIAQGIKVPVYQAGTNHELSILPEKEAASLFTNFVIQGKENRSMNEKMKDALRKLFGEDKAEELVTVIDSTNRTIADEKLITRSDSAEPNAEDETTVEADAIVQEIVDPEAEEAIKEKHDPDAEFELDDEAIRQLAEQMAESEQLKSVIAGIVQDAISKQDEVIAEQAKTISDQKDVIGELVSVVQSLQERADADDAEYSENLPSRQRTKITLRPRQRVIADDGQEVMESDSETIASATLSAMSNKLNPIIKK